MSRFLNAALAFCVALSIAGCGQAPASTSSTTGTSATDASKKDAVEVTVIIDASEEEKGNLFEGTVKVNEGQTVYSALLETGVSVESTNSDSGIFITSIGGVNNSIGDEKSGWVYYVNDELADVSCNKYELKTGDKVSWIWKLDASAV